MIILLQQECMFCPSILKEHLITATNTERYFINITTTLNNNHSLIDILNTSVYVNNSESSNIVCVSLIEASSINKKILQ